MNLQIIALNTPNLHQFNKNELRIVRLSSNPDKFDELIFKNLRKEKV